MKKTVIFTQRVEIVESYGERRDCADQRIAAFLGQCGYLPVPVPNALHDIGELIEAVGPAGIVLTGGNSLSRYGGNAPERDRTDRVLIGAALKRGVPLYGFCRGMQSVLDYFGCELEDVPGHVTVRHKISGSYEEEVNSYHNQACRQLKEPLRMLAQASDGVIEAVEHPQKKILATMWHPEREQPYKTEDMQRVRTLFG